MIARRLIAILLLIFSFVSLYGETTSSSTDTTPVPYGPAEFPDWQKDLRRAEILSFGALPFVTFFSSIYFDIYRYYSHDQEEGYLPWPLKKAESAIPLTETEQKNIFFYSACLSLGVAIFDYGYRTIDERLRTVRPKKRYENVDPIQIEPIPDGTPSPGVGQDD